MNTPFVRLFFGLMLTLCLTLIAADVPDPQAVLEDNFRPGEELTLNGVTLFVEKIEDGKLLLSPPAPPTATLGAFITPVDVTASHAQDARGVAKIIDGSGWGETFPGSGVFVHTNNVYADGTCMWNGAGHRPEAWLVFDLGSVRNVAGFYLWNYNEGGGWHVRGIRDFNVLVSDNGKDFQKAAEMTVDCATGKPDDKGQAVAFEKPIKARYFKFDIRSNHNPNEVSGISEIRFADADRAAPPPGKPQWVAKYAPPQHPKLELGEKLAGSENIVFPDDMGIVDVTKAPYFAKGDGKTDDTAAIRQALSDYPDMGATIYLPNGVYLVSDTIRWPRRGDDDNTIKRTTLQGQSERGTIIRLKDASPRFADSRKPRAVLWCGRAPAQRFGNEVRNLTVDTGFDNPGACGVQFIANNQGGMFRVTILSGDGRGAIGLDMAYTDEQGPLLIRDVTVQGFDVGIATAYALASETLENITLRHQNVAGLRNGGQPISIRKLRSLNDVPAVIHGGGVMTLIDCELRGTGDAKNCPAVSNAACILVRNLKTAGYATAIESKNGIETERIAGPNVAEFRFPAPTTLLSKAARTLNLPIRETPDVPWDDLSQWVSVAAHGAKPGDGQGDSDGIQRAIDSGASTVYLPRGEYHIDKTIIIRGNVRRIIGGKAFLIPMNDFRAGDAPVFRFEDGKEKIVVLERLTTDFSDGKFYFLENAATRTLVMHALMVNFQGPDAYRNTGTGDVFIEDMVGQAFTFKNQSVWARQFNCEVRYPGPHVVNDGGTLWALGYKTEGGGTQIETRGNGRTEILGGLIGDTSAGKLAPMIVNDNSRMSVIVAEVCFNEDPFDKIVLEKRGTGEKLWRIDTPLSGMRYIVYEGHDEK